MKLWLAVIQDLYHFATSRLRMLYMGSTTYTNEPREQLHALTIERQPALPSFSSAKDILQNRSYTVVAVAAEEVQYVSSGDVRLCSDPVYAFDTSIMVLPYGLKVHVQKFGGRWAYVRTKFGDGWVLKDALTPHVTDVFASFHHGTVYDATHTETKKLRYVIEDIFFGAAVGLPLTDAEYVFYRLTRSGKTISFSLERPRTQGTWQKLLRGMAGIHIGIHPKEGSVIEYEDEHGAHLGYVETLLPDESVKIATVGARTEGEYTETYFKKEVWKELRPVFIESVTI